MQTLEVEEILEISEPKNALEDYRQILAQKGIGKETAWKMVCENPTWWTLHATVKIRDLAYKLGFSYSICLNLAGQYNSDTSSSRIRKLNHYRMADGSIQPCIINPWEVIADVNRYTITEADKLAEIQNIPLNSPDRMIAITRIAIDDAFGYLNAGDSYVSIWEVKKQFEKLTRNVATGSNAFDTTVIELIDEGEIRKIKLGPNIYLTKTSISDAECYVAKRMLNPAKGTVFIPGKPGGTLGVAQENAYYHAFQSPLTILDAPPGYGKTHTIAAIVKACVSNHIPVAVGTFMARAAIRVTKELMMLDVNPEKLIAGPGTLHSILKIDYNGNAQIRTKTDPKFLSSNPGIFIIDEASMVSSKLMGIVMTLIPGSWNIVIMGDSRQLPPIDSGDPFGDMIRSEIIPVIRLDKCYRTDHPEIQEALSAIRNYSFNIGSSPSFTIRRPPRSNAYKVIGDMVTITANDLGCDPRQLLVVVAQSQTSRNAELITTNNYGNTQSTCLNKELKRLLNPDGWNSRWWLPVKGDRVAAVALKGESANQAHKIGDYQRAYNGELGTVIDGTLNGVVTVAWDNREIPAIYTADEVYGDRKLLQLAYAVTVHKVQGTEAPAIIFVADGNSWKTSLTNSLVYTACSRGKERVIVISISSDNNKDGFDLGITRQDKVRRTLIPHYLNGDLVRPC